MSKNELALAATLALAPWIAAFAPLGIAPLFISLAVIALWGLISDHPQFCALSAKWWLLAILPIWAGLTALWADDPARALTGALLLGGQLLGAGLLAMRLLQASAQCKLLIVRLMALGLIVVCPLMAVDVLTDGYLWKSVSSWIELPSWAPWVYNRSACIVVLMVPATMYGLWRQSMRRLAVLIAIAAVIALLILDSGTAVVAALMGAFVWLGAIVFRPRLSVVAAVVISLSLVLFVPVLVHFDDRMTSWFSQYDLPFSTEHRLYIWKFATDRILEKPWLGWGMDASRALPGGMKLVMANAEQLPLHPHNMTLQIWLELGAVGIGLSTLILMALLYSTGRLAQPGCRAMAFASFAAAFTVASLGYGIWQSWWMSTLGMTTALTVAIAFSADTKSTRR